MLSSSHCHISKSISSKIPFVSLAIVITVPIILIHIVIIILAVLSVIIIVISSTIIISINHNTIIFSIIISINIITIFITMVLNYGHSRPCPSPRRYRHHHRFYSHHIIFSLFITVSSTPSCMSATLSPQLPYASSSLSAGSRAEETTLMSMSQ